MFLDKGDGHNEMDAIERPRRELSGKTCLVVYASEIMRLLWASPLPACSYKQLFKCLVGHQVHSRGFENYHLV